MTSFKEVPQKAGTPLTIIYWRRSPEHDEPIVAVVRSESERLEVIASQSSRGGEHRWETVVLRGQLADNQREVHVVHQLDHLNPVVVGVYATKQDADHARETRPLFTEEIVSTWRLHGK